MSGSSRYSRVLSAEVSEIERRLRSLEKNLESIGARASTNARETAGNFGDAVAAALGDWADRFRHGAGVFGDQSAAVGKDAAKNAAKLGGVALRRVSAEVEQRPLVTLAVAIGVGILIGMAGRRWD
jgi:ElaB/YqjD/DUF883 family membrane-anchored ribosome-binding protein